MFFGLKKMLRRAGQSEGPERAERSTRSTRSEAADFTDLTDLGELYHDYSFFRARSLQYPGIFALNQASKAPIIRAYIQWAIARCRRTTAEPVSFTELFCADGYYAMAARQMGADRSIGVDNDRDHHFRLAPVIARRLGLTRVEFVKADVAAMADFERTDIVANLGGLYHMSDPARVLHDSYALARKMLIVQTVYSLARTEPDYFQTPAPVWTWGCRFSRAWLERQIQSLGGKVLDAHVNELEGNTEPADRGSAYFLIEKAAGS